MPSPTTGTGRRACPTRTRPSSTSSHCSSPWAPRPIPRRLGSRPSTASGWASRSAPCRSPDAHAGPQYPWGPPDRPLSPRRARPGSDRGANRGWTRRWSAQGVVLEEPATDDHPLDVGGALSDQQHRRLPVETLDLVLDGVLVVVLEV